MITLFNNLGILAKDFYYKMFTGSNLLEEKFENFGRKLGLERKSLQLFLNLISIVRYFEFDFRNLNFSKESSKNVLDNSSLFLFNLFMVENYSAEYFYITSNKEIYVEIRPFFSNMRKDGLREKIKIPYYDIKQFKRISNLYELTSGIAINCLAIKST